MTSKGISGKDAERILEEVGISVSRSTIPNDPNPPMNPSGVRFGTPAATSRGIGVKEIKNIVNLIDLAILNREDKAELNGIKKEIRQMCAKFPVPSL